MDLLLHSIGRQPSGFLAGNRGGYCSHMTPSRNRLAPPSTIEDLVAWLNSMPPIQREKIAKLLAEPATVRAVGLCRAQAVVELTKVPGASWASVAALIGASEATVNRLVTVARKAANSDG